MQSPENPKVELQPREIEPGLYGFGCPESGGLWIPLPAYLNWREQLPAKPVIEPLGSVPTTADDSKRRAYVCPESGKLMLRYKVGNGLNFHLDRSPATGGVWLDQGEWEALKSRGLHTQMHLIFTASYQRQVRSAGYEQSLKGNLKDRIGNDFERVEEFKDWLLSHPRRQEIFAYLAGHIEQAEPETDR